MENALQMQNDENTKLNQKLLSQTTSFNSLLDIKEKEINELKKCLREAEFDLREERRKINSIISGSTNGNLNIEQLKQEYQEEWISENKKEKDNLNKELALLKKSLKESLDMNDVLSLDLQKTKHKRILFFKFNALKKLIEDIFEIKQKEQEIAKYRQMLERFDQLDDRNKNSPNNNFSEKCNINNINGNGSDQEIAFTTDKKIKPEEFCKGCFLF